MKKIRPLILLTSLSFSAFLLMFTASSVSAQGYGQSSYGYYGQKGKSKHYAYSGKYSQHPTRGHFVRRLPRNSERFRMGNQNFYMHRGVFYKRVRRGYEVIPAPIGLRVKRIPVNSRRLDIGRQTYYVANGTYYLDLPRSRKFEIVQAPVRRPRRVMGNYQRGRSNQGYMCRPVPRRR